MMRRFTTQLKREFGIGHRVEFLRMEHGGALCKGPNSPTFTRTVLTLVLSGEGLYFRPGPDALRTAPVTHMHHFLLHACFNKRWCTRVDLATSGRNVTSCFFVPMQRIGDLSERITFSTHGVPVRRQHTRFCA
jgi:hypothetical protein